MKTFLLSKSFAKVIRWLLKAVALDPHRPPLQYICYRDGVFTAADGFRMHLFRTDNQDIRKLFEKNILIRSSLFGQWNKQTVWVFEEQDGTYPNYWKIIPEPQDQIYSVAVNPQYLVKALTDFPMTEGEYPHVILRFFKGGKQNRIDGVMTIENKDCTAVSVIMPMYVHPDEVKPANFAPFGVPRPEPSQPIATEQPVLTEVPA